MHLASALHIFHKNTVFCYFYRLKKNFIILSKMAFIEIWCRDSCHIGIGSSAGDHKGLYFEKAKKKEKSLMFTTLTRVVGYLYLTLKILHLSVCEDSIFCKVSSSWEMSLGSVLLCLQTREVGEREEVIWHILGVAGKYLSDLGAGGLDWGVSRGGQDLGGGGRAVADGGRLTWPWPLIHNSWLPSGCNGPRWPNWGLNRSSEYDRFCRQ